jgi:hypothetical protein
MKQKITFTTTILVAIMLLFSFNSFGQGNETFANYPETGSSYEDGTFTGQDGSTWDYFQCRGDQQINGETPCLGKDRTPTAEIQSGTISGGIGTLNFDYEQAFSTNVELEVYVNGSLVTTVTSSSEQGTVKNSGDIDVNVSGDFTIQFIQANTGAGQVSIDNVEWTAHSGPTPPSISNISISPEAPTSSDAVTVSADVTDEGTIDTVFTAWGTTSGDLTDTIGMSVSSGDTYACDTAIPAQAQGTEVFYTVTAMDETPDTTASSEQSYVIPNEAADISALRGGTIGEKYTLTGEAVISHMISYNNQKYIQDATGGILIYDSEGVITTSYSRYDGITGLTGTLEEYNGVKQLVPTADPGAASSTGNTITPEIATINAINTSVNDYESELIKFEGVEFIDAGDSFETGKNYGLTDGNDTITFRTNFYSADYIGNTIPYGSQNITVLVGEYKGTAQVTARENNDFELLSPQFSNITLNPTEPTPSDAVTISADVTDNSTIDTVFLAWGTTSGTLEDTIGMTNTSGDTYATDSDIPSQTDGTTIYYEISAKNTNTYKSTTGERSYAVSSAGLPTLPYTQDFENADSLEGIDYKTQVITGNLDWYLDSYNNDHFAEMSNYDGGNTASETYLITTGIDLSGESAAYFSFNSAYNYEGDSIEVFASVNYEGDVTTADWDTLSPELSTGGFTDVFSGYMDFSSYVGDTVHVAFKYTGTDSDGSTWQIDDIQAVSSIPPQIDNVSYSPQNPTSADPVTISADVTDNGTIEKVSVAYGTTAGTLEDTISMTGTSGTYTGDIPAQADSTTVYYTVSAVDNESNMTTTEEMSYDVFDPVAVSLPFTEAFDSTDADLGQMKAYNIIGDNQGWEYGQYETTTYAVMSGYSGSAVENEDWLITPMVDLSNVNEAKLSFTEAINYGGTIDEEQEVYVSTDYSGAGDPTSATWEKLPVTNRASGDSWTFVDVTPVDLSSYAGESNVSIAFKYTSTTDNAATWEIDSLAVTEGAPANIAPEITSVSQSPAEPAADEEVQVNAVITDANPADTIEAVLKYGTAQDDLSQSVAFTNEGTGTEDDYAGVIPGQSAGTHIYYVIEATDGEATTTTDVRDYQIPDETSIIGNDALSFEVYPNPSNGQFSIELDSKVAETYKVAVFNTVGKMVYQNEFGSHSVKQTINLTDQNDGIYFLKVTGKNTNKVIKLIKE